jgi:ribonuclease BN (tRNA processing enzyme)
VAYCPIEAYRPLTLGGCRVTPLETNHLKPQGSDGGESFGYLFEDADGTRMAYLVDAQADLPEATAEALLSKRLDCLIWECTFAKLDKPIGHTDIAGLIGVGRRFSPRKLVATHISHQTLGHRELTEALAPEGILVAHDGMRIRVRPRGSRRHPT